MVDWTSPKSIADQNKAIDEIDFMLFGIMIWEIFVTAKFDWGFISRRKPFKWPYLLYCASKFGALTFIIVINVTESGNKINCQAAGDIINVTSGISMAGASGLLMLRMFALWGRDKRIVIPMVILHLTQWGINLHNGFFAKEHWGDIGNGKEGCIVTNVTWEWFKVQFIYAMSFDFIVLVLACYALLRFPGRSSGLWRLLFIDGLVYFIIAFVLYLACTIVAFINPSVLLAYMFSDIATILVSIAACRSFVRLATRANQPVQRESSEAVSTGFRFAPKSAFRSGITGVTATTAVDVEEAGMNISTLPRAYDPAESPVTAKERDIDIEAQTPSTPKEKP